MSWLADSITIRGSAGQDRARAWSIENGLVIAVADGAGGRSGGGEAADRIIARVDHRVSAAALDDWPELLREIDRELAGAGETTAVIAAVIGDRLIGASAGDSRIWRFGLEDREELSEHQHRLRVGSGAATPVAFGRLLDRRDVVVAGSDGLFNYVDLDCIGEASRAGASAAELVELVRQPDGGLLDDVAALVLRYGG